ncbi:MAG: IspD/TarI family cytidylyltransferase [Streptomycetales bacterium]
MKIAAVVPAAGRGERSQWATPPALRDLGGAPLFVHAVRVLCRSSLIEFVVVAAPPGRAGDVRAMLADHRLTAGVGAGVEARAGVVEGGPTRRTSILLALESLAGTLDADDAVIVHDAARPLAPGEIVDAVVAALGRGEVAVVPAIALADTVKEVGTESRVTRTIDRSTLRVIQTPQGFRRGVLESAYRAAAEGRLPGRPEGVRAEESAADDATLLTALGQDVLVVDGHADAFPVVRPLDLVLAEAVLASRPATRGDRHGAPRSG